MGLTQLECFKATVAHKKHDGFLFYVKLTPALANNLKEQLRLQEEEIGRYFGGMYVPQRIDLQPPAKVVKSDFSEYYKDINIPGNAFIDTRGVLNIPGNMYHFIRYVSPLRNAERFQDIKSFPYPKIEEYTVDHMADEVKSAHEKGKVTFSHVGHMFEDAWQLRRYEQFLLDMFVNPEWCEFILDRLKERNLGIAQAAARAGVDYLHTGDDVGSQKGMMFSPQQWRRFIKPRWAEVYAAARKIKPDIQIWYHSDGNIEEIIPELIEIGVSILNPVQPECLDPIMVKRKYGDKIIIDGTIGTQTTMPFGTPEDVRNLIRERVKTLGYDGALILSPTHVLEPEVPLENIKAFLETVKEFGTLSSN